MRSTALSLFWKTDSWALWGAIILAVFSIARALYLGIDLFLYIALSFLLSVLFFVFINMRYGRLPTDASVRVSRWRKVGLKERKLLFFLYIFLIMWGSVKTEIEEFMSTWLGVVDSGVNLNRAGGDDEFKSEFYIMAIWQFIVVGFVIRGYIGWRQLFVDEIYWLRCVYAGLCLFLLFCLSFIIFHLFSTENTARGEIAFTLMMGLLILYMVTRFLLNLSKK